MNGPLSQHCFTSWLINSDSCIDIWAWCGTLSWNSSSWNAIFNPDTYSNIFGSFVRIFQFSRKYAVFLQVKSFLFPLSGKGLVPKDAHVLTDALIQSLENVILVESKLCWEMYSSLLRKQMVFLTSMVVIDLDCTSTLWIIQIAPHFVSVVTRSFERVFCHCYSHNSSDITPWTRSLP